ncbi:MAG: hypothetical protein HGA75_15875, partial [Thiobacillus sp.]|nr:hypothetical protein [Thiobacillus sp.]
MKAIDIIHSEHRALAAVLQALRFLLDEIGAGRLTPDPELLGHMIEYITQVPDKLHHPKEDDVLFRILREHVPEACSLIDKLQADHVEGARHTGQLEAALALRFLLDEIGAGRLTPDPELLGHMIEYITQVPDKL